MENLRNEIPRIIQLRQKASEDSSASIFTPSPWSTNKSS